jgi:putative addiction module component (TIGR02574 family)
MNTQLLAEAQRLPPDDQMELIAALWGNITARSSVLLPTDAQKRELDRRLAEHLQNPDDVIPWDEVKISVHQQIK